MANIVYAKTGLKIAKTEFGLVGFAEGYYDDVIFLINVSYNNPDSRQVYSNHL